MRSVSHLRLETLLALFILWRKRLLIRIEVNWFFDKSTWIRNSCLTTIKNNFSFQLSLKEQGTNKFNLFRIKNKTMNINNLNHMKAMW